MNWARSEEAAAVYSNHNQHKKKTTAFNHFILLCGAVYVWTEITVLCLKPNNNNNQTANVCEWTLMLCCTCLWGNWFEEKKIFFCMMMMRWSLSATLVEKIAWALSKWCVPIWSGTQLESQSNTLKLALSFSFISKSGPFNWTNYCINFHQGSCLLK